MPALGSGINLTSSFDVFAKIPLDARTTAANAAARDAIPNTSLYAGLFCYVVDELKLYVYDGTAWVEFTSGGGGVGNTKESFVTDGINDVYALTTDPLLTANMSVNIEGSIQLDDAYDLLLGSLVFTELPPAGLRFEVTIGTIGVMVPADNSVTEDKIVDGAVTEDKIATGAITKDKLAALGSQLSASCGNFSTTSNTTVDVTNLTVSINTTGRPVVICLIGDGSAGDCAITASGGASDQNALAQVRIIRGVSTTIQLSSIQSRSNATPSGSAPVTISVPGSSINCVDFPAPGLNTYKIAIAAPSGSTQTAGVKNCRLFAYEL